MDNIKTLSIRDFSKIVGKSRQAIYQQLFTSLQPYVNDCKGQKRIDIRALKELYDIDVDSALQLLNDNDCKECKPANAQNKADYHDVYIQSLECQIDYLKQQLTVKDSQIESLTNQLQSITTTLSQQQSLNMESLKQLGGKKTEVISGASDADAVPEVKKGFFKKVFFK